MWPARNEDGIQIIGGVGVALAKPRVAIAKSKGPTCMLVALMDGGARVPNRHIKE